MTYQTKVSEVGGAGEADAWLGSLWDYKPSCHKVKSTHIWQEKQNGPRFPLLLLPLIQRTEREQEEPPTLSPAQEKRRMLPTTDDIPLQLLWKAERFCQFHCPSWQSLLREWIGSSRLSSYRTMYTNVHKHTHTHFFTGYRPVLGHGLLLDTLILLFLLSSICHVCITENDVMSLHYLMSTSGTKIRETCAVTKAERVLLIQCWNDRKKSTLHYSWV